MLLEQDKAAGDDKMSDLPGVNRLSLSARTFVLTCACLALSACTMTAAKDVRSTAIEPVKSVLVAANVAATILHVQPEAGAPAVIRFDPNARAPAIVWLGHSSFLIRLAGRVILLDPMFSQTLDLPLPFTPKRLAAPPPGLDRLDQLDGILISHTDHDHFDLPTLRRLSARFPDAVLLMPEGTQGHADTSGFKLRTEVPTWQSHALRGLRLTALPSIHYGRRDLVGLTPTEANGWEIKAGGHKIFFSGDTGYSAHFRDIRARQGQYTVALVPIGAWKPQAAFADVHINPEDALLGASELGAPIAIAHHWGTFNMGAESPREARARFLKAKAGSTRPVVLAIGETFRLE
jgi:L-ascorbate metabolism protein UlaG (beta-lactamase superfamily)